MDSLRAPRRGNRRIHQRLGLVAIQDLILFLGIFIGLSWLISCTLKIASHVPSSAATAKTGRVYRVSVDVEGRHLCLYRPREGLFKIDLATGETERSLPVIPEDFTHVEFSSDGSNILVCHSDGKVVFYRNGKEAGAACTTTEGEIDIDAVVSVQGNFAACVAANGRVDGWSQHGSELRELHYQLKSSPPIQFVWTNPTGRRLCIIRNNGDVSFHESDTGECDPARCEFNVGSNNAAAAWSEDEQTIVVLTQDLIVKAYDVTTGSVIRETLLDTQVPHCNAGTVRISPDGRWVAIATDMSMDVFVWSLSSGRLNGRLSGHTAFVRGMQFSPDSNRLYTGGFDGTAREWSRDSMAQLRVFDSTNL